MTPFADCEVANAEPIAALRAVGTARQSALALPRGKAAATARFITETRISIRGRKLLEGIGLLSFTAFLFALEKANAAGPDVAFTDDGKITLKDLEHGSFELITKEANPRHIIVDDPEQTIILRHGSAGIAVEQVTNTPAELVRLQAAQQEVLLTYAFGRATQADANGGAGGSSTGFDFGLQKINFNETLTPLDTAPRGGFVLPSTPPPSTPTDTIFPSAGSPASLSSPIITLTTDTGVSSTDRISSNGALAFSGVESRASLLFSTDGGTTWTTSFTPAEGSNTVLVRADLAGTLSDPRSITFTLDMTPAAQPGMSLSTDTGVSSTDKITNNGALTLTAIEDGVTVEYSIDGKTWTTTYTPHDGSNTVLVRQTDVAGNTSSTTTYTFILDTIAPTAAIAVAPPALHAGERSQVTITFSEAVSGFTIDDLKVENGALSGLSSSDGGITWTATLMPWAGVSDTTNVVTLDNTGVQDAAGNTGKGTTQSDLYSMDTVPTASVTVSSSSIAEDGTSNLVYTISLDHTSVFDITVNFTLTGTATEGTDYGAVNHSVVIPAGSTTATVTIAPTTDQLVEANETVILTFTGGSSGSGTVLVSSAADSAIGTISDNDANTFSIGDVTVNESAGTMTFTVTRTGTSDVSIALDYATANGSALAGSDYTASTGTVTFAAGTGGTQTFTVPILDDSVVEGSEELSRSI